MIGFSYNGIHSRTYDIVAKSINRPVLPVLRKRKLVIPGRDGSYDFGNETYEDRIIEVELKYVGTSFAELRTRARTIAAWLSGHSGTKNLIFDDETGVYYTGKIYSEIGLQNLFTVGTCILQFECEPFAYAVTESSVTATVTATNTDITVSSSGTFETPPIFYIENNGSSAIATVTLTIS